jgi:adenylylsulfate kinase-like enzyme
VTRASSTDRSAPRRVVWITGLPCSGKSTLARHLAAMLRPHEPRCIVLDGDQLRPAIAADLGYSLDDRRRCGWRYARLAALLAGQDALVLVATLSLFEEVRRWSRANAPGYFEVYLRVPERVRRARDRDGLYDRADVVGVDQPYEEPVVPDLVVDDDGALAPDAIAQRVLQAMFDHAPCMASGAPV